MTKIRTGIYLPFNGKYFQVAGLFPVTIVDSLKPEVKFDKLPHSSLQSALIFQNTCCVDSAYVQQQVFAM
jgi:hypothetical protein